MGRQSQKHFPE